MVGRITPTHTTMKPAQRRCCWYIGLSLLALHRNWFFPNSVSLFTPIDFWPVQVKLKAFHTRYRELGPELIPVYRQSARGRLPLLSARPAVTSPAAEHHPPLAGTKLYCLVTEAHRCEQLDQGCYAALPRAGFDPATY